MHPTMAVVYNHNANIKIENLRKSVPSALLELHFGYKNTYLVVISTYGGILTAFITN